MPLIFVRNDITAMHTDAIVNAAKPSLLGGGGVDGAIHRAAGPELLAECAKLGGCRPGEAKATGAYRLPCRHIIHTVGPRWEGGQNGEEATLRACYASSLRLADELGCESVAFPLISAGIYGYPKAEALRVAEEAIRDFFRTHDLTVYLVLFDPAAVRLRLEAEPGLAEYIDDHYVEAHSMPRAERNLLESRMEAAITGAAPKRARKERSKRSAAEPTAFFADHDSFDEGATPAPAPSLEDALNSLDESFSQMLLRKITEKGMTDAQCYKKANIDRKLFSKIRSDTLYKPSKATVLAFAVALELPIGEAEELLRKAGFAFSHASKFDVIVEYYLRSGIYDVFRINEALFAYDQSLLGC